jgi:hypothetical protein
MDRKKFALIKYDHDGKSSPSAARWIGFAIILTLAAGPMILFFPFSLFMSVVLVPVSLVLLRPPKQLCLGPRYLICGSRILYYANIQRVTMEPGEGRLMLKSSTGQILVLERDKFHTGARKPHKIEANKTARFEKVAQKIVTRVREASPSAVLTGVGHLRATST